MPCHHIKQKMKTRNKIYIQAKCNQNESDWAPYRQVRNEVNNLIKESYHNYCILTVSTCLTIPTQTINKGSGHL